MVRIRTVGCDRRERHDSDGNSLSPVAFAGRYAGDIYGVRAGRHPLFLYFSNWDLQCARLGPWKLHMSRGNVPAYTATPAVGYLNLRLIDPELYNIDKDPEEAEDVSDRNRRSLRISAAAVAPDYCPESRAISRNQMVAFPPWCWTAMYPLSGRGPRSGS